MHPDSFEVKRELEAAACSHNDACQGGRLLRCGAPTAREEGYVAAQGLVGT